MAVAGPESHDRGMTTDSSTQSAILQSRADAAVAELLGGSISVRVRGDDSAGAIALVEQRVPAGYPGPPLHVHPDFDELFYVLGGELSIRLGDDARDVGAGGLAFVPRGVPHTFANRSDRAAHSLVIVTPAGHERYFDALVERVRGSDGMPRPETLRALNEAHGTIIVGA
jgi:mannose-6-phosphate isomerase-like protein (cupin superfamily)